MAAIVAKEFLNLIPLLTDSPENALWTSYNAEADVLYVNFRKPSVATESDLTDDDIILRYEGEVLIGLTILHASKRCM